MIAALVACLAMKGPISETKLAAEFFSWADSLGFRRDLKKPFVEVEVRDGVLPAQSIEWGFLLEDRKDRFRVLSTGLVERVYFKPETRNDARVSFRSSDFRSYVRNVLNPKSIGFRYRYGRRFTASIFGLSPSLAWICHAKGLAKESKALFRQSASNRLASLKDYVISDAYAQAVSLLDETPLSRAEVLQDFDRFAKRYRLPAGKSRYSAVRELLAQMVREDERHVLHPPGNRVAELIWQLRNESHKTRNTLTGPAQELEDIGFAAVPQLLDALRDRRFARLVQEGDGGLRGPLTEDSVLRVRECAKSVLEAIAANAFEVRDDRDFVEAERKARAWWADIRKKGERAVLIQAVRRGNTWGPPYRLATKYPDVAFEPIVDSIVNGKFESVRAEAVSALESLPWKRVEGMVRWAMKSDASLSVRYTAAQVLASHDADSAVAAMQREWKTMVNDDYLENRHLLQFLFESGRPSAIRTLAQEFHRKPQSLRVALLEVIFDGLPGKWTYQYPSSGHLASPDLRAEFEASIEDFLGAELESKEVYQGGFYGAVIFVRPRLSHLAAYALAECFPKRYRFPKEGSDQLRDRQCAESLEIYRRHKAKASSGPAQTPGAR